ncbi:hypothetical protein N0V93_010111 [Gnomoniopsis smithogilvyi]|uniref:Uncharacterized protein n=1 Tax=Gnomoniopsis smithogilvyi TaxID=1191159 RepID=A0A9W8YIB5_9PEZI|nr:hypothetical protein N0V93_010111 [Gnomoniopsis smithogilvyi]
MPDSRRHRTHDDHGYKSSKSRDRVRPRVSRRSSSYDDISYKRDASRSRRSRYHDDYSDDSDYDSPPPRRSRRAKSEGRYPRHRSRSLSRDSFDEQLSREKRDQAIKSALTAGAVEAFRQRNRPGEWLGEKGLRVATAAMSAAAIDSAVDKNPRRKGKRNVIGSTLGGLVVDKLASGIRGRK